MSFTENIAEFAGKHRLFSSGDRVLVAVSGGPDSVALLHALHNLREELGLHLEVAHLQHGIRGEEAREDARFVAALADALKLPFHLKEANIPDIKKTTGKGNIEALARAERYRFFTAVAEQRRIHKIATAHTLDDQAETVLMWFLRGCGARGLGGMSPLYPLASPNSDAIAVTVVRPFLGTSKAEILEYLREHELVFRRDKTNEDPTLLRNWIRLSLLPRINQRIDARWPARLAQQAALLRDEDVFMDQVGRVRLEQVRGPRGLDRESFLEQEPALQRRILRLWIAETRGHLRALDYGHVEALRNQIAHGAAQARLSIPGGWELVNEYKIVKLEKCTRELKNHCYHYELHRDGDRVLPIPEAGMMITGEHIVPPPAELPRDFMEALFDAGLLTPTLIVRNFRNGDRFRPLGMVGHRKVKEVFIENKVPLSVRANLPLLLSGREIVWIPGYGRSDIAKVSSQTTSILRLRAVPAVL